MRTVAIVAIVVGLAASSCARAPGITCEPVGLEQLENARRKLLHGGEGVLAAVATQTAIIDEYAPAFRFVTAWYRYAARVLATGNAAERDAVVAALQEPVPAQIPVPRTCR
jgi:hypothetical protein